MISAPDRTTPTFTAAPTATMSLPQYGFSTEVEFEKLVNDNHFLFRVYTPKAPIQPADDTSDSEIFFVAPKFDEKFARSPEEITGSAVFGYDDTSDGTQQRHIGTYEDVAVHMDWSTRSKSPYVSTSFSFIWSIWEALRRYHQGVKKDVEIAVIDASAVVQRAATAVQLLQAAPSSCRRPEHWKWYRHAQESQSVLVHTYIPSSAVLASIPLPSLLSKLPSYFLRNDTPTYDPESSSGPSSTPNLAALAWDYTSKKLTYRKFCLSMSTRFLHSSPETRTQDTTAGSVRLALAFLRPWFHARVVDDFPAATVTLCALAWGIAQWPGQWWAQEHSELWDLVRAMVLSLAEEVREAEGPRSVSAKELVRLRGVVGELEDAVEKYKEEISARSVNARKPNRLLAPLLIPPPLPLRPAAAATLPELVSSPPSCLVAPSSTFSPAPATPCKAPVPVKTPITPPTSPIRRSARGYPREERPSLATMIVSCDVSEPEAQDLPDDEDEGDDIFVESPATPTPMGKHPMHVPDSPGSATSDCDSIDITIQPPSSTGLPITPDSDSPSALDQTTPDNDDNIEIENEAAADTPDWVMVQALLPDSRHGLRVRKTPSMAETASCVVTGFLIGAFITLCLLSPQRRTLLTHLT
ncbi:hypothetical protein H0H92_013143 [Tricholoma furcatifolium]|nr:hypothetical protein H0H92_013143 [Tricholoma furcatifolium]